MTVSPDERAAVVDDSVDNPLPIGARDLLPPRMRRRRAVESSLLTTFEQWGYREVTPPLIEYFEVLGRGLGADEVDRCVRFIEASTGELVGLRSDVTPQIARMIAQRIGGTVAPGDAMRLCYAATSVRLPTGRDDRAELHQVGVEFVGEGGAIADAELIGLADRALRELGLTEHRLDVGHTAVVRQAFGELALSPTSSIGREVLARLARKDRAGVARAIARHGVSAPTVEAVAALCELHGPPEILERASDRLAVLGVGESIEHLRALVAAVEREHPKARPRVLVDLGEVRGFDYYTGVRIRVWAPGASEPIVRGGRYDDMLRRYGADVPATGFAVDLDAIEAALLHAGLELDGEQLPPARLVATAPGSSADLRRAAIDEVRRAHRAGRRSWIDTELDLDAARSMAERRGADRLTWVRARPEDDAVVRERWRRTASGWAIERRGDGDNL